MPDPIVGGSGSTLYGTAADDVFELSGAPSMVDGLAGNDTIVLTASIAFAAGSIVNIENFQVRGGLTATLSALTAGYHVSAPPGETTSISIVGSTGADTIVGGDGNDRLEGAQGNDVIDGGKGNDTIIGGPGYDILRGGEGDDHIQVKRGTGSDYIDGGSGTDRASIDAFTRVEDLTLDLTNRSISQSLGEGTTIVDIEQVSIVGGSGNDRFTGGLLADTLTGSDGDDVLRGGGGNDTITGGNHYDVAVFSGAFADYQITELGGGSYRVTSAAEGTDTLTGIETLRFADGDRPIAGYTSSATYWGSSNGSVTLASASDIPDGRGATPGTGFTITGLVRLEDGTFWASNEGQADETDTTYTPSLVHIAADGTTKLGEIVLPSSVRAVQGLAVDEAGGRLFYASLSERLIRFVSYSGAQLGTMTLPSGIAPNALTYDATLNALIVGLSKGSPNNNVVQWRSLADNTVIKELNVGVNPDHLFLDMNKGTAGTLYVSYGEAPGIGYIAEFDVATGVRTGVWTLPEADAIEGISIVGTTIWAANDAYYHHGDLPKNQIQTYTIDQANAYQLVKSGTTVGLDIDLARHDQTLADGTRLVGVERLFFNGGDGGDIVGGGRFNDVLVGNDGADHLRGAGGDDRLIGSAQDDELEGGIGNDGLEGGSGFDTAVYSRTRASYQIDQLSSTSVRITDLTTGATSHGVDVVAEVEQFVFADGTFSFAELFAPPPPPELDISLSATSISENSAPDTRVGTLSTTTTGSGSQFTYTLLDNADGRFVIIGAALFVTGNGLDYETAQTHDVRIRVTDNANDSVEEVFTITIGDANDAPTDIAVSSQVSVAENTTIETRIANIGVVDADTDPTFRVYAFATNDRRFEVKNGSLFLKAGQVIDFETAASIQVVVTATDESGSVSQLVTVAVTDVSEGSPTTYRGTNGDDTVTTAADFIYGRKGNDIVFATSPSTATVSGGEGNDHIEYTGVGGQMVAYGGDQADTIIGGGNADQLHGEGGDDTISGNGGNDTLNGGDSSDLISGGEGDDAISGQGGNDQIDGGLGDDTLSGGLTSYDVFIFTRSLASGQPPVGWGQDIVTDFERGRDHLNLSGSGLTFASLTIAQQGSDALIVESESQSSVLLLNQNASLLKSSDFYF